jgi:DNA-binding beta-propeller fold protein YncE
MPEVTIRPVRHAGIAVVAAALLCLFLAAAAHAADSVYWVNIAGNKISHANTDGSGGGDVPITGAPVGRPSGLAIDAAAGRLYWANRDDNAIHYAKLDGSGGALLNTAGATAGSITGLAIDPAGGRLYWANTSAEKISFANLDGSGGGDLNTTVATMDEPAGLVVVPTAGRVYWSNAKGNTISFANLDGSGGGGDLDTTGATVDTPEGVAVDLPHSRIYWTNFGNNTIAYASLSGGGGGQLNTVGAPVNGPFGLAINFSGTIFWANYSNNSIAYANPSGGSGGQINTAGATLEGTALPVLLDRPHNSESPAVLGAHKPGSTLTCSQGKWYADRGESFLALAPQTFSYQWFRNGKVEAGATSASFKADKVGTYACVVTAANYAGTESTVSAIDFSVNATVSFKKVTYNRKKGTATLRVAVTGAGRLDVYGKGVANAGRKRVSGTAKIVVRTSGKARIKLRNTGKARVKATVAYTPEGGKAIKRRKTVVLKKKLRR